MCSYKGRHHPAQKDHNWAFQWWLPAVLGRHALKSNAVMGACMYSCACSSTSSAHTHHTHTHLSVQKTIPVRIVHFEPEGQHVVLVSTVDGAECCHKLREADPAPVGVIHGRIDGLQQPLLVGAKG